MEDADDDDDNDKDGDDDDDDDNDKHWRRLVAVDAGDNSFSEEQLARNWAINCHRGDPMMIMTMKRMIKMMI